MAEGKDSAKGAGCLALFGSVFLIVGLAVGYFALQMVWDWAQSRSWEPVPAEVLSTNLEVHSDSDSTTYQVTARYRYQWQGRSYTGERVGFSAGADNIGSYHEDTHDWLSTQQSRGEPVTAWVDPDDPAESVLIRDMRWGLFFFMMIFPLVFGGVGGAIVVGSLWAGRKMVAEGAQQRAHPEEPWRWKEAWKSPQLRCKTSGTLWFAVGFAVIWNAISAPLLFILPEEVLEKENHAALLGLLFPLVGAGLAAWAIHGVLRWRRYGRSIFQLTSLPVALGGSMKGELRCPNGIDARELDVQLRCQRSRTTGSGKSRSTRVTTLWEDSQRVPNTGGHGGARVPVGWRIPADAAPTDESDSNDRIGWVLSASAEVPGVDYVAEFEIPVFRTERSPAADDPEAYTMDDAVPLGGGDWRATGVVHSHVPEGERFYLPPFRRPVSALILTVLGGGFTAGAWFAWQVGEWFVMAVVGLFALVFDMVALGALFGRSELVVRRGRIRHRSGMLWMGNFKELNAEEVKRLFVRKSGSTGNTVHYDIKAERWGGEPVLLIHNVDGRRDVQALIREIAAKAGIKSDEIDDPV